MKRKTRRIACAVALFLALVAGCDTREQRDDFLERAGRPASGYVHTDDDGTILDEDEDDWQTSPLYAGVVVVEPARPNPATVAQQVQIPVNVRGFGSVRGGLVLRAYDSTGRFIVLDEMREASSPGYYVFDFNPLLLGRRGLQRLFIIDGVGELVSYGDLLVQ